MYRLDDFFYSWAIYIFWLLHKRNLVLNKSDHDLTPIFAYKIFGSCSIVQNFEFSFCGCETEHRLLAALKMGIKRGYSYIFLGQCLPFCVCRCDDYLLEIVLLGRCTLDKGTPL